MYRLVVNGNTSNMARRWMAQDGSGASPGKGFTGLTSATSGLTVAVIADNEASATVYTSAGSTIDGTITTLGTYQTPTSTHIRLKEVDATNQKGLIEIHFENSRYAVSGAKMLYVTIDGVTGMLPDQFTVQLTTGFNLDDAVRAGLTALPNVASGNAGALLVDGTGTAAISNSAGKVLLQATQSGVTIPTVTTVTNQLTGAAIATSIWQDATAGDFTTASSIGKSLYTSGAVPGAAGGIFIAGTNAATTVNFTGNLSGSVGSVTGAVGSVTGSVGSVTGAVGSVTGAVGSVTGNVGGNVVGSVASVTAGVTVTTNNDKSGYSLAAGSIVTATFGTCDFTAAMKASLNAATVTVGAFSVGALTAAGIATGALNGKGDWNTIAPDNATIDSTASAVNSIGSIVTAVKIKTDLLQFDGSSNIKSTPQTQVDLINAPNATAMTAFANELLDLTSAIDAGGIDTVRKALRIGLAALAGKASGAGTSTITFRDTADAKNRIVGTTDSSGDRTALVLDAS